ncbi:hypothetical protein P171DRAFT_243012 [Karstenula rhodostoma CBS 690.94]|uniref:Uncharacterized protein n=1 Tax=Karstenula rhodostoma CBS 690.94 TaxID=1392251 RepID=A0A9P4PQE5_9PLEO|nr:hypothetical protein P171DRAFT_243012 [Karstenula rhodostoma CBS 690.94]
MIFARSRLRLPSDWDARPSSLLTFDSGSGTTPSRHLGVVPHSAPYMCAVRVRVRLDVLSQHAVADQYCLYCPVACSRHSRHLSILYICYDAVLQVPCYSCARSTMRVRYEYFDTAFPHLHTMLQSSECARARENVIRTLLPRRRTGPPARVPCLKMFTPESCGPSQGYPCCRVTQIRSWAVLQTVHLQLQLHVL